MRDRAAERCLCGSFRVEVDELVVKRCVGEGLDAVLVDLEPVAGDRVVADQLVDGVVGSLGVFAHNGFRSCDGSLWDCSV